MTTALPRRSASQAASGSPERSKAWDRTAIVVAAFVMTPVAVIAMVAAQGFDQENMAALTRQVLGPALLETLMLVCGVLGVTLLIGVTAGWLVATYRFPMRNILGWGLVLPFAVPTYISAYSYVEFLDYFGPLQGAIRALFGFSSRSQYWFPEVRSQAGATCVTALVLYPYIYVASRAAFTMQGANLMDAARSLGCSRMEALHRVVLPVVWPMLAAAGTLVVLETLNDIGASQYLGVNTLTVAIFNTWLTKGNLAGAAQIALVTLIAVLGTLKLERSLRSDRRFVLATRNYRPVSPPVLMGWRGWIVTVIVALPVIFGFAVPAGTLMRAAWRQVAAEGIAPDMLQALGNTLLSASLATGLILGLALILSFAKRFTRMDSTLTAVRTSGLGYALPGTVLVIGLLPALGFFDRWLNDALIGLGGPRIGLVLSGSLAAIVLAYTIRFLAIGLDQTQAALGSLSRNTDYAAHTLGCPESGVAWRILAPALRPALAGAAVLIFVDCLKELPATLLLRPLNFETLATHLYGHASRGSFEDGALAALLIVAAGLLPLTAMNRMMESRNRSAGL